MQFVTQNGQKTVEIKEAKYKIALELKRAVLECLANTEAFKEIDPNNLKKIDTRKLFESLGQFVVYIDKSEIFEDVIFKCLEGCIYDKFYKITPQLFDDKPEIREDYYEIITKCAEVNLRPFFKSLVSALKEFSRTESSENPEQESLATPIQS